jgi:catechol 2,3-dioxygenase-like lactoylglutathione lyase family enzyme
MNRFHVHVSVADLDQSIGFYSTLFGAAPSVRKPDYAKWMLDDPRVNFAISTRSSQHGVNHLGIQVENAEGLQLIRHRLGQADRAVVDEKATTCCYSRSDKHWATDPQGVAWETFHTLGSTPVYGEDREPGADKSTACCVPTPNKASASNCCAKPAE